MIDLFGVVLSPLQLEKVELPSSSEYSTRNQLDLDIPRLSLEFSENNFFYSRVKTWNDIPLQIRTSPIIATFKTKLKEFLQN